jgi:hypothetical protein
MFQLINKSPGCFIECHVAGMRDDHTAVEVDLEDGERIEFNVQR